MRTRSLNIYREQPQHPLCVRQVADRRRRGSTSARLRAESEPASTPRAPGRCRGHPRGSRSSRGTGALGDKAPEPRQPGTRLITRLANARIDIGWPLTTLNSPQALRSAARRAASTTSSTGRINDAGSDEAGSAGDVGIDSGVDPSSLFCVSAEEASRANGREVKNRLDAGRKQLLERAWARQVHVQRAPPRVRLGVFGGPSDGEDLVSCFGEARDRGAPEEAAATRHDQPHEGEPTGRWSL